MSYGEEWVAYGLWLVIIGLGVAIAVYAFRAARSSHSRSLALLAVGFVLVSAAAGLIWVGLYATVRDPLMPDIGACAAMVAGFSAVLASLFVRTT